MASSSPFTPYTTEKLLHTAASPFQSYQRDPMPVKVFSLIGVLLLSEVDNDGCRPIAKHLQHYIIHRMDTPAWMILKNWNGSSPRKRIEKNNTGDSALEQNGSNQVTEIQNSSMRRPTTDYVTILFLD
ncbi:Uncharacterized protein Fot_11254 [Forsythia ovata]|uniref:Uncharacterized protein n=1 Tax=Forsythia ovata TaxID=205694 RepID=A0ABD1WJ78_9LAMI